jgi:hypothetical protein
MNPSLSVQADNERNIYLKLGSQSSVEMLHEIHQFCSVTGKKPGYLEISHNQFFNVVEEHPISTFNPEPLENWRLFGFPLKIKD